MHSGEVRSIDYNPNKQYTLVTAGDDGMVKFWDTRRPDAPLLAMAMHSHWAWAVRYNPFHDQLLLSVPARCAPALVPPPPIPCAPA